MTAKKAAAIAAARVSSWHALVRAFRGDGYRSPRKDRTAAERAALRGTPVDDREGLELLNIYISADASCQPLDDAPSIPGPLIWWDFGDPAEAAEEYGCARKHVKVVATYDGTRWREH